MLTFEEFSVLSGQDIRKVEFDAPSKDIECLRRLPDFKGFDTVKDFLIMLKQLYGLKDAPRFGRKTLHQVFSQWVSCRQFYIEPELSCVHKEDDVKERDSLTQANAHIEEQHDRGTARVIEPQVYTKKQCKLQCLRSFHVDDIKGIATRVVAEPLLAHLNKIVGQCKVEFTRFPTYRNAA